MGFVGVLWQKELKQTENKFHKNHKKYKNMIIIVISMHSFPASNYFRSSNFRSVNKREK